MRRGDGSGDEGGHGYDRAVTVQIGAILLLAILFSALALYQINVVPAENENVEFDHSQDVQNQLQEVRNAVRNIGLNGGTRSIAVTLGTQYPTRTVSVNPPAPTGTLATTDPAPVRIANATYVGSSEEYRGDPSNLTGQAHETTTLVYEPNYHEYRTAPTTRIEHGLAYNEFEAANVSLTDHGLIRNGTVRLVLLDGSLSETGRGSTSLDMDMLSGPSDEIPITETAGNITLTLPTASPDVWVEQIGSTFETGEQNAKVAERRDGAVDIELAEKPDGNYRLQMARVGIGTGGTSDGTFDVERESSDEDGTGGTGGAYTVDWETEQMDRDDEQLTCSTDCTFRATSSGDTATAIVTTSVDQSVVDYAVDNTDIVSIRPAATTTGDGMHESALVAQANGTTTVFASSGGVTDRVDVTVRIESNDARDLPDDAVAYRDANGNGAYDDGETTYAAADLGTIDINDGLVVAKDAFRANGVDISAGSVTVRDGVRVATEDGEIQLASDGPISVAGTLDTTDGSGQTISIDAGDTERVDLSSGTIRSSGSIEISAGGAIVADGADIDATDASSGSIGVSGAAVSLTDATARTEGGITMTSSGRFDASGSTVESTGNGQEIAFESSGDMVLERTAISVGRFGTMTGDLSQGRNDLYVGDAEFRRNGDPGTYEYSPNGVDVIGDPAVGSTA